jgi:dUTP pyrophosphatase
MIDKDLQVQINGVELTLKEVEWFVSEGCIGFDNQDRRLARTKRLKFGTDDWLFLTSGVYKVIFNEIVHIPDNICAIAMPRSSLLRCGVTIETAVWDSGYTGRSEAMLIVYNSYGFRIKKNARLIQLMFFKLPKPVSSGYTGRYHGENI